jgi:nitroreductase
MVTAKGNIVLRSASMELFETIRNRRSVRNYTGEPVACEDLEKIIEAARLAASGNNIQPWEFIVITEPEILRQLRFPEDHWSQGAGAMVAVVMDSNSRWWLEDGSAAVQNMLLACTALGYGACWLEGYTVRNEQALRAVLGIPKKLQLFTLVSIGVPAEQPSKEKKPLHDVLHWQRYPEKPAA